jgi:hypothetical protein
VVVLNSATILKELLWQLIGIFKYENFVCVSSFVVTVAEPRVATKNFDDLLGKVLFSAGHRVVLVETVLYKH